MLSLIVSIEFAVLASTCAPNISPQTLTALVNVESGFNPYAIGVVNGYLERQPISLQEAIVTANALDQDNWNWSAGLAQINKYNFKRHGLTNKTVFDPCLNLMASSKILSNCYLSARQKISPSQALFSAFSCYYSGNFTTGYKPDRDGTSYVEKIVRSADITPKNITFDKPIALQNNAEDKQEIPIVPSIDFAVENTASVAPIKVIPTKKKQSPQSPSNKQKISSSLLQQTNHKSGTKVF